MLTLVYVVDLVIVLLPKIFFHLHAPLIFIVVVSGSGQGQEYINNGPEEIALGADLEGARFLRKTDNEECCEKSCVTSEHDSPVPGSFGVESHGEDGVRVT